MVGAAWVEWGGEAVQEWFQGHLVGGGRGERSAPPASAARFPRRPHCQPPRFCGKVRGMKPQTLLLPGLTLDLP